MNRYTVFLVVVLTLLSVLLWTKVSPGAGSYDEGPHKYNPKLGTWLTESVFDVEGTLVYCLWGYKRGVSCVAIKDPQACN